MRHRHRLFTLLLAVGLLGGCEHAPGGTTPPPPAGPTVLCPSDITVSSDTGGPLPVHFDVPAATSANPPVTVKCAPESDSEFPVGSNPVVCTAVDTVGQATCNFRVAVTRPERQLKFTKFMAFGDSITQGFLRDPADFVPSLRPLFLEPTINYPYMLEQMLRTRYGNNEIVVINEGLGGETIEEGTERIVDAIALHQPQVVLILEGYNHLTETPLSTARSGLRSMARWAQTHGADVIPATLFQVSDDREESRPGSQELIDDLNDAIRGLGVTLGLGGVADLEQAFGNGVGLLGSDGLHPNPAGYQKMADVFLQEIIRRFEVAPSPDAPPPPPAPSSRTRLQGQSIRRSGH